MLPLPSLIVPLLAGLTEALSVCVLCVVKVVEAALLSHVPVPIAFTWKVYDVPAVRPVRLTEVLLVVFQVPL